MRPRGPETGQPHVDIIVSVFNEARTIAGKIDNLLALEYPGNRLRFIVVDGGSTDGTCDHIAAWAAWDGRVNFQSTSAPDKTRQLNVALKESTAEWVLVTDSDSRMSPGALHDMVREGLARADVTVVGTLVIPRQGHALEVVHWRVSNWIRRCEHRCGTTGLVIAAAYLFRRTLLDRFPEDCVADDVYVACLAAATATRVALAEVTVQEVRAPASMRQYTEQKVRRARGYLREVLRFLPGSMRIARPMSGVFAWRAAALIGAPFLGIGAGGTIMYALIQGAWAPTTASLVVLLVASSLGGWRRAKSGAIAMLLAILTIGVLTAALVSYPFVRQTACYKRVVES